MFKRLELNSVAGRVEEEHGGLFAGFTFEADVRLDEEFGAGGLQALGEFVPLLPAEYDAEVAAGDVVAVDLARFGPFAFVGRALSDALEAELFSDFHAGAWRKKTRNCVYQRLVAFSPEEVVHHVYFPHKAQKAAGNRWRTRRWFSKLAKHGERVRQHRQQRHFDPLL
jgi:hypothetical protein